MYPTLNRAVEYNATLGVTEMTMLSSPQTAPPAAGLELTESQEQQQPLNQDENSDAAGQTRLNGAHAVEPLSGTGGGGGGVPFGAMPRRKVKFIQKLMNFCGDPKRREQTCSKRNRTFTLCKEIIQVFHYTMAI